MVNSFPIQYGSAEQEHDLEVIAKSSHLIALFGYWRIFSQIFSDSDWGRGWAG